MDTICPNQQTSPRLSATGEASGDALVVLFKPLQVGTTLHHWLPWGQFFQGVEQGRLEVCTVERDRRCATYAFHLARGCLHHDLPLPGKNALGIGRDAVRVDDRRQP